MNTIATHHARTHSLLSEDSFLQTAESTHFLQLGQLGHSNKGHCLNEFI